MADPLDALRQPMPPAPVAPRPAFAATLRDRIEAALRGDPTAPPATGTNDATHPNDTVKPIATDQTDTDQTTTAGGPTPADERSTTMPTTTSTAAPSGANAQSGGLTTDVSVTPYLCCRGAAAAIDFYVRAFGAVEQQRLQEPSGRIGHASIMIGGSLVDLADEYPEMNIVSPTTLGGTSCTMTLEVPNCDEVFARAVAAGATVLRDMADQFYGYRAGQVLDPFGHRWAIRTKLEDVGYAEMQARFAQLDD